jgi:putative molybdopterin biosynthesis protein
VSTLETTNLLSVAETAQLLRVSRATAYRLIDRGDLPAHRVGGSLRIDRDELREWLNEHTTHEESDGR